MTAAGDAQVFDDLRLTAGRSVRCLRYGNSRQTRHLDQTRRIVCAGQHRRSRADRQLQPLQEAAERLGWSIVGVYRDEGISGARGRDKRPGLDALLKGVSWREFDIVAAWSVCRLGRSLSDLIGRLSELRARDIDLYLHVQGIDAATPSGRMLFGMLGVFAEFERAMIGDRVMAGLDRARAAGKRLGRPRVAPYKIGRMRAALDEGRGVRETARLLKVSPAKVSEVRRMSVTATSDPG